MLRRWAMLLVLLALLPGLACEGDEPSRIEPEPTRPPSMTMTAQPATSVASPAPAETPVATATAMRGVTALGLAAPIDLPAGYVLWVELGCHQCDGPTTGFRRLYRGRGGRLHSDDVLPVQVRGAAGYVSGMAFAVDGSDIVLAWCAGGNCGPAGQVTAGARTTLYRSRNGGITYEELARFDEVYDPLFITGGRVLVAGPYRAGGAAPGYRLLPGNEAVVPPPMRGPIFPVAGPDGAIWWSVPGTMDFVDRAGAPALTLRGSVAEQVRLLAAIPGSRRAAYSAFAQGSFYVGVVEADGKVVREFAGARGLTAVRVMLDERVGAGQSRVLAADLGGRAPSPFVEWLPALIDLEAGMVTPLAAPFLEEPFRNGRNTIHAAVRGTFARIANTGSCLNLRARPDPAADIITCVPDGVLARVQAVAQPAGGPWFNLRLPDGREGWASGDYLEQ